MAKGSGTALGAAALAVFVAGGIFTFSGIGYILFVRGFGPSTHGEGTGLGAILIGIGLFLSMLGVLVMRIIRNRWVR